MGEIAINPIHNVHKQYRQMIYANPYRFGVYVPPIPPNNTFIGGVASVINTPALFAAKLLNYPSGTAFDSANIQNFTIVGDDIECYIGVDYQIANSAFLNNNLITQYESLDDFCKLTNTSSFSNCSNLTYLYFNDAITLGASTQLSGTNLIIDAKNCIKVNPSFVNGTSGAAKITYLPNCNSFGNTVGNDSVFINIFTSLSAKKYYLSPFLETSNGGAEEGDVAYARSQGANIVYVLNQTAPNPITDLTIGNVYGTAIQLNFTEPTGSINSIEFYEVWINGRRNNKAIYTDGCVYAVGLTLGATYNNIEVKPVDIYHNKSTSNIVSQATSATYVIPTANIVSNWQMENNVLDSVGSNDGTPTAITYAAGLVGQAAVFNGSTSKVIVPVDINYYFVDGSTNYTISCLFKGTSFSTVDRIIFGYGGGTGTAANLALFVTPTGELKTVIRGAYTSLGIISVSNWYAICLYVNGSVAKINVNGTTFNLNVGTATNQTTFPLGLVFGFTSNLASPGFFNGLIDECSIFDIGVTAGDSSDITAKLLSGQHLI